MKNALLVLSISSILLNCQPEKKAQVTQNPDVVRINQLGYFENGSKKFVAADTEADAFQVLNSNDEVSYEGELVSKGIWDKSGEEISIGDFSALKEQGEYKIRLSSGIESYKFSIGKNIYDDIKVATLKSYYLHRISMPIEEQYAGIYKRPLGHEDLNLNFHPSSGREGTMDSPRGWYDAGDYGKYTINAGITTGIMLAMFERYPDAYSDGIMNIPESGNDIPDILDELKYEIDWMLTMQDEDGGGFVKVTTPGFGGMVMPHEAPKDRIIIGKSTAASLHLAAIGAMSARIYEPYDQEFAAKCLEVAEKGWKWAVQHPEVYYESNPEGIHTGAYNDVILDEEFFWAAAELFVTTGKSEYFENIQMKLGDITFRLEENWRNYTDNVGYYSLVNSNARLDEGQKKQVENGIIKLADELGTKHRSIPYQVPVDHFVWGSNSDFLDAAMIYANAYEITGDQKYLDLAVETFDYILGKTAVGYSFITGFGSKRAMKVHHRPSEADGIVDPLPGFVIGGPNFRMEDKSSLEQADLYYASELPAKAYIDELPSFASNEICINWNAPCVYMLGFFDAHKEAL